MKINNQPVFIIYLYMVFFGIQLHAQNQKEPKWLYESPPIKMTFAQDLSHALRDARKTSDSLKKINEYYNINKQKLPVNEKKYLLALQKKLATKTGDQITLIKNMLNVSDLLVAENNIKLAAFYDKRAIKKAEIIKNDTLQLIGFNKYAGNLIRAQKNDSVIVLIDHLEQKFKSVHYPVWAAVFSNKGIAYEQKGEEDQAVKYYLKAYAKAESYQNKRGQVIALYNIGFIYNKLQQYQKALKYLNNSKKLSQQNRFNDYVAYNDDQIAYAYSYLEQEDKAIPFQKEALDYFKQSGNKTFEALTLKNLASNYYNLGQDTKALMYARKAIKEAKKIDLDFVVSGAKQTLIMSLIDLGKLTKAEKLLSESEADFKEMDLPTKIDLFNNFYQIYEKKGQYKKALAYYKKVDKLQDSVMANAKKEAVSKIEAKYQSEKKEKENQLLKHQKDIQNIKIAKQHQQNMVLASSLAGAVVLLGLLTFLFVRIKKQKKLIEQLQRELHHRVKNNLSVIYTMVKQIKDEFKDTKLQMRLNDLQNRIISINEIHQQLYQKEDIDNVNLKKYIDKLAEHVQKSFGNEGVVIENKINHKLRLNIKKTFALGLFINEFLTNSFKHAFNQTSGVIKIEAEKIHKNKLLIRLRDNGTGFDPEIITKNTSFGIKLMKALAKQLGGDINMKQENGLKVELKFDIVED